MLVADLSRVYAKPPDGYRKIILSSNIAESCMSFDDVRYVIDCGLDCTKDYVPSLKSTVLRNIWISKSIAIQRQTR
ncbi:putative ATP-dependent RNA helicase YTHDC2 [Fasciolopsis buskii]|uniref:Putative ATP-dependent RNA helicase YTHDC2 n=1 Tax=Fasciolopsis buskii TaxID=27845 RepID=A0A8E0S3U0_9TREM|nr:putative ATP-dependent RNA helicase YTHDC2 [Fasciolopsis buski]